MSSDHGSCDFNPDDRGQLRPEPWLPAEEYPGEPRKTILTAFRNPELLQALGELARRQRAYVRLARPGTPDIIPFPANIKIIDRQHVGKDSWQAFCAYLDSANREPAPEEYPGEDDDLPDPRTLVDETPLVIVDRNPEVTGLDCGEPRAALGPVHYINQDCIDAILDLTFTILAYSYPISGYVAAREPPPGTRRQDSPGEEE